MECELDRLTIHYETFGEGIPLLVLHGVGLDRGAAIYEFEPVMANRGEWRRIYVDLPGHGETPGPAWLTGIDALLDLLVEFVDKVVGDERLVVAGSSFGGYLARGLVHRMPQRLDGVCLIVPSVIHMRNVVPSRTVIAGADQMERTAKERDWPWYAALAVTDEPSTREYVDALSRTTSDPAYSTRLNSLDAAARFELGHLPAPFPAPALILTGRQDHMVGYRDAWRVSSSYPRATFAVLDRAGHFLRGEQPRLFSALVGEWLSRVEEWVGDRPADRPDPGWP
ncbi:MAG TPA: alpha/beta hydrolase [Streptosporangiaceae bacterium]|nr:alpha/beta hydrolase [Streptosporangiaceae bacterium]